MQTKEIVDVILGDEDALTRVVKMKAVEDGPFDTLKFRNKTFKIYMSKSWQGVTVEEFKKGRWHVVAQHLLPNPPVKDA